MNYPIAIHKDSDSDYGVIVPDLPGCFSAGRTLDEAVTMAKEAVELHLEGLIEEGHAIPEPATIDERADSPEYAGATWAVVSVDPSDLRTKAKRVNITMPERVLDAVDRFAAAEHETRSGLLVKAVTSYIGTRTDRVERLPKKQGKRHPPK
jgi:predicted RNase H-like HicB family nuclease